jgi:hypothetical protein
VSGGVSTGTVLNSTSKDDPCRPQPSDCVYFDENSEGEFSQSIPHLAGEVRQVAAFNIPEDDYIVLQQAAGSGEGDYFEDVVINGCTMVLNACTNRIQIPFPGTFRLRYVGEVGTAFVVCETADCCEAELFPRQTMNNCPQFPSSFEIMRSLALQDYKKQPHGLGACIASCDDLEDFRVEALAHTDQAIAALPAPTVYVDTAGDDLPSGSVILTPDDLMTFEGALPTYVGLDGEPLPSGTCLVTCGQFNALELSVNILASSVPDALNVAGTTLQLLADGNIISTAELPSGGGSGITDVVNTDGLLDVSVSGGVVTANVNQTALKALINSCIADIFTLTGTKLDIDV